MFPILTRIYWVQCIAAWVVTPTTSSPIQLSSVGQEQNAWPLWWRSGARANRAECRVKSSRVLVPRAKKRNEPRVKPKNDPEPSRAELRAKQNEFRARIGKSGLSGFDEIWWRKIGFHCLPTRNVSNTAFWLPKDGPWDMLTLTSDSSVDQHFLPAPTRAELQARAEPNQTELRIKPEPGQDELSRAPNKAVPSQT